MKITSKELFTLKSPFGYVSKEMQQVIINYLNVGDNVSFTYQHKNDIFIQNMLAFVCFDIVCKNIGNEGYVHVDDLRVGQHVVFKNQGTFIFKGVDTISKSDEEMYILSPIRKTKKAYDLIISKKELEDNIALSRNDISTKTSNAKALLSRELGIDKFSRTNENKILIIAPKKEVQKILGTSIRLNGERKYFGELVGGVWLSENLTFEDLTHTDRTEDPAVVFTSSEMRASDYLDENRNQIKYCRVFKFGIGEKASESEILGMINLQDCCQDYSIPIGFFSNISFSMQRDLRNEVLNNFEAPLVNKSELQMTAAVELIHQNDELNRNLKILNNWLKSTEQIFDQLGIVYKIKKIRHLMLAGCGKESVDLKKLLLEDEMKELPPEVLEAVTNINTNRYCLTEKKQLRKIVSLRKRNLLLVPAELLGQYQSEFKSSSNLDIRAVTVGITESLYDNSYDEVILINPTERYLKKWIYSELSGHYLVFMPSGNLEYFRSRIRQELNLLNKIKEFNYSEFKIGINELLQQIKRLTNEKTSSPVPVNNIDDIVTDNELSEIETDNKINTQSKKKILLQSGRHINATPNYRPYVSNKGILEQVSLRGLREKTKVIEFETNKTIVDIISKNDVKFRKNYRDSEYWKNQLVDYCQSKHMTALQLQIKMESIGYYRSIGFYQVWSDVNKQPLVPQDAKFIMYIGKLINNVNLIQNYEYFYQTSCLVKETIFNTKNKIINSLIYQEYIPDKYRKFGLKVNVDIVTGIEDQNILDIPRNRTNKFMR